jgi:phosphopantothenate synthetase
MPFDIVLCAKYADAEVMINFYEKQNERRKNIKEKSMRMKKKVFRQARKWRM